MLDRTMDADEGDDDDDSGSGGGGGTQTDQQHHRWNQPARSSKIALIVHKQVTIMYVSLYRRYVCVCIPSARVVVCRRARELMMMFTSIIITCARFIRDNPNAIALRDVCAAAERVLRNTHTHTRRYTSHMYEFFLLCCCCCCCCCSTNYKVCVCMCWRSKRFLREVLLFYVDCCCMSTIL